MYNTFGDDPLFEEGQWVKTVYNGHSYVGFIYDIGLTYMFSHFQYCVLVTKIDNVPCRKPMEFYETQLKSFDDNNIHFEAADIRFLQELALDTYDKTWFKKLTKQYNIAKGEG
jgi:hypothetical protein